MSLQACADIVQRGDPDRFAAAMAAPVAARRVLFPIYAFNVEVARAPWVTEEPMIAEMRLQWWRDALEEIEQGKTVRKHEVTTPLSEVIQAPEAKQLDRLVQARRWDVYKDAFEDDGHFADYLTQTGGALMSVAARLLGAAEHVEDEVRHFGAATALVRFLIAVPRLEEQGRIPLIDGRPEAIADLLTSYRKTLTRTAELRKRLGPLPRAALIEGWQTEPLLAQIENDPMRVAEGRIGLSEFRRRTRLLRWSI